MSNRTDLSTIRAALHDLASDLLGVQTSIIAIQPAADVRHARAHVVQAVGLLTDALSGAVDVKPAETVAAERQ